MKRRGDQLPGPNTKRPKAPDYTSAEPVRDGDGSIIWPAPESAIDAARKFIRECAEAGQKTVLVPDKDADGLSSGVIMYRTLTALGLAESNIEAHLLSKGFTIHDEEERMAMLEKDPKYIIAMDLGSAPGPRLVDSPDTKSLVIDHHLSDEFPDDTLVVSACHYPPVATSSLLTYEICKGLVPDLIDRCGYLCAIGTHGDLGNTLKWNPPFPDLSYVFKTYPKKQINDAVSLLNAPRRTAKYDVSTAWEALLNANDPRELLGNGRLQAARSEVNQEVERCSHAAPKFSKDGRIAVLRIQSTAQVHPVVATRWAGSLNSKKLEIVMCANEGYLPGMVNFSCRIAKVARDREPPVNIIESLKAAAALSVDGQLVERMGVSFARGHKEASGGIVPKEAFEELMTLLKVGEKPDPPEGGSPAKKKSIGDGQKNNLMNYFKKT